MWHASEGMAKFRMPIRAFAHAPRSRRHSPMVPVPCGFWRDRPVLPHVRCRARFRMGSRGSWGREPSGYCQHPATVGSRMPITSVGTKSPDRSGWSGSLWSSRSVLVPAQPRTCPRGVFGVRPGGRALGTGRQPAARAEAAGRRNGARAVVLIPYSLIPQRRWLKT